jgi:hypothetical protein
MFGPRERRRGSGASALPPRCNAITPTHACERGGFLTMPDRARQCNPHRCPSGNGKQAERAGVARADGQRRAERGAERGGRAARAPEGEPRARLRGSGGGAKPRRAMRGGGGRVAQPPRRRQAEGARDERGRRTSEARAEDAVWWRARAVAFCATGATLQPRRSNASGAASCAAYPRGAGEPLIELPVMQRSRLPRAAAVGRV